MSSTQASQARNPRIEIRSAERRVLIDGTTAKLGARAFDVLQALYERRDRLMTKNELLEIVWPGVVVEENNLQVQISTLRKLLGPGTIATIPGRGYQYTGVDDAAGAAAAVRTDNLEHTDASSAGAPAVGTGNLPDELPPLIGRDADLEALRALVAVQRLVSIVGAAGIGKTVLAQALARDQRAAFEDGAWLIELAPVSDPALVVPTVAGTLAIQAGDDAHARDLADRLRGAHCLLVLDNCEHLLHAAAELARVLLRQAPGVRIVVTAQEPLKLPEEHVYRLDALALPDDRDTTQGRVGGAVALFEARARAADPRFELNQHNLPTVIDICRQLDGLPLAIELAAARIPLLGIDGLHARLGERLHLLTAGHRLALRRHQTLRAALEWSHGLLTKAEQAVFRRLGAFVGSFDLACAQQVGTAGELDKWSVLDHLGALVDKSLVMAQPGEPPRYRLLESGRAYALEKLQEAGETEATMQRHLRAMHSLFEKGHASVWSVPLEVLRDRCAADVDNLRAALDWAARDGGDGEALIALAGASSWIWSGASALEGQRRCALAMSRIAATTPKADEARLLLGYARTSHPKATRVEIDALERAIALCRETNDRLGLYFGFTECMFRFTKLGRLDEARRATEEARTLLSDDLPPGLLARFFSMRAHLHAALGDYDAAAADKLATLHVYERCGDERGVRMARANVADMTLARGQVDEAVRLWREHIAAVRRGPRAQLYDHAASFGNLSAALTRAGEFGEAQRVAREALPLLQRRGWVHLYLDHAALLALQLGRAADAARTLGRSRAVLGASGDGREINEQRAHDDVLLVLRRTFASDDLERLFADGAVMSDEEAARTAFDGS